MIVVVSYSDDVVAFSVPLWETERSLLTPTRERTRRRPGHLERFPHRVIPRYLLLVSENVRFIILFISEVWKESKGKSGDTPSGGRIVRGSSVS